MVAVDKVTSVLPANPGFELLEYHHNEGGADACVSRSPIVGWKVFDNGAYVEALAVETFMTSEPVIKCPDGRVIWQECQTWEDEGAWFAYATTRGNEKQKLKIQAGG